MTARLRFAVLAALLLSLACGQAQAQIVAAVLPSSRSVQVGHTATAFATIINAGTTAATGCAIALGTSVSATFSYQTTNPATNGITGTANTPVTIAAGGYQTFVLAVTPTAPFASTDVAFNFSCNGLDPAPTLSGINTLLLTASSSGTPDIVALGATIGSNGTVALPTATGAGAFAVATVNVGAADTITVAADTGATTLPVTITVCETVPATGQCMATPNTSVQATIAAGATPTFAVFVTGTGNVAALPGANRVFVRFTSSGGVVVGSTSVAVQTTGYTAPAVPAVMFEASAPADATVGMSYSACYCSPTPSGSNGLCGYPTQSNPTGGNPPYHFQLGSGGGFPPIGVILQPNGCLSGTPTVSGTSNFTVCAIDLNGAQVCRPTSVTTDPSPGITYSGPFSGSGTTSRSFPSEGATCTGIDSYSGTITVTQPSGTVAGTMDVVGGTPVHKTIVAPPPGAGTVTVFGTLTSTITGGSTANFTCLDSTTPFNSTAYSSVVGSTITWSTSFTKGQVGSAGTPYTITGTFNGTITASGITGTLVESGSAQNGTVTIPISIPATQ